MVLTCLTLMSRARSSSLVVELVYRPLLEVAKELHARGVKVVTVLGFANKDAVILETELAQYGQVFVTIGDGSMVLREMFPLLSRI